MKKSIFGVTHMWRHFFVWYYCYYCLRSFLWIPAFAADPATANPTVISTFQWCFKNSTKESAWLYYFYEGVRLTTLFWAIDFLMILSHLINLFAKALQRLAPCLAVNNKLWGKLFSTVPIMSDDQLKVTPVAFFAAGFNLCSWKSDNLAFTSWYPVILCQ